MASDTLEENLMWQTEVVVKFKIFGNSTAKTSANKIFFLIKEKLRWLYIHLCLSLSRVNKHCRDFQNYIIIMVSNPLPVPVLLSLSPKPQPSLVKTYVLPPTGNTIELPPLYTILYTISFKRLKIILFWQPHHPIALWVIFL